MAAIVLEGVSKKFTLRHERPRSLQETFLSKLKRENSAREELWVLRDVSFEVSRGQTVGLIGPNGAGKSTVLKLISRIVEPTLGRIKVNGRVGTLLELGAGFHPDLTGRENIYLNASILGLSRAEIQRRLDEIIAFSELDRFIDIPVKHYSSGMYVRLGFSTAVHTDPEVLLVDEVLAVGDQSFQTKCIEKIAELRRRGVTILLVSHSMTTVQDLCTRVGWIEQGELKMYDVAEPVIAAYLHHTSELHRTRLEEAQKAKQEEIQESELGQSGPERPRRFRCGNGRIRITKVAMVGDDGQAHWTFQSGERVRVRLHYEKETSVETPVFSVLIYCDDGLYISGTNTCQGLESNHEMPPIEGRGCVEVELGSLPLTSGAYLLSVGAYTAPDPPFWADPADYHDRAYQFNVESDQQAHGLLALQARWRLVNASEGQPD